MSESWNVCLNMIPGHNSVTNQVNFVKKKKERLFHNKCFFLGERVRGLKWFFKI